MMLMHPRWQKRISSDGDLYITCEASPVPRIEDYFLECVVYLYKTELDAKAGERFGGCGFLVAVRSGVSEGLSYIYAVTNSHVVAEGGLFIRLNRLDGTTKVLKTSPRDWFHHTYDDLAVCQLIEDFRPCRQRWFHSDLFITEVKISEYDIGPGEDIFMVSRFIGHDGRQRNLPSVRFGNIAMMPLEPIHQEREDGDERDVDAFLVEARSLSGASGSPVFVWIPPFAFRPKERDIKPRLYGPWLLGVDFCHLPVWEDIVDCKSKKIRNEEWVARSNSGMIGVAPAWKLAELLEDPALIRRRKELDEEIRRARIKNPPPVLDSAERPFTKTDMETALKKVSRRRAKPSPPDEASSET